METVVLSDLHLSEAQPLQARRPLWMAYKRREFFVDDDFERLVDHVLAHAEGPLELVLNGDIFDFDNVTQLPPQPAGRVDWLARLRGLASEEWMSLFKIECIIADHPRFFEALGKLVRHGHRVVFVVGNHDVELYWPSVQRRVREAIGLPPRSSPPLPSPEQWAAITGSDGVDADSPVPSSRPPERSDAPSSQSVRRTDPVPFCPWFYLSEGDTFISHGHQYDPLCVTKSPIHPLVSVRGKPQVRISFGDLATRYLLNGMGYFNPHATENYIMTASQYVGFFFRYMLRTQPLLVWTWFWGALVTFFVALGSHLRPAMRDPLLVDERVQAIAWRSQASPAMVRQLNALSVPSASSRPLALLRELWLDRGLLLLLALYAAWQIILFINIAVPISALWVLVPLALFMPPYLLYAARVRPTVFRRPMLTRQRAELIAKITGAERVVFGHTHKPERCTIGSVSYLNGGFWSAAFAEPECIHRIGTQTFVWIRPEPGGARRRAQLLEWPPGASAPRPFRPPADPARPCGEQPEGDPEPDD